MTDANPPKKTEEGITKRPNYFAGQYLLEDDFKLEQNYHIDRQRRHNRLLYVSGVAEGLAVSKDQGLTVKVSAGTAFDSQGRQIILLDGKGVDLVQEANNNNTIEDGDYTFSIRYSEELTDLQGDEKFTNTRVQEKPVFVLSSSSLTPDDTIALAKLTIQEKNVTEIAPDVRQYSGIYLPGEDEKGVTLRSRGVGFPNEAILEGELTITKGLVIRGGGYFHAVHIVGPLQLGNPQNISPVIRVNNIVNEISEGTQEDADKALPTVKAAVDYADTKAKKNGDSNENFTAAQLTATQLTINNGVTLKSQDGETPDKAILDGSLSITGGLAITDSLWIGGQGYFHHVHMVGSLQLGNVDNSPPVIRVNNIVNEISEGTQEDADKALPTVKAAVDYADTKAKKNGDSNENFTAAQLIATQLTINNKAVKGIKDEILENDQENETSLPTIAAVISYLDTAVKNSLDTESQSDVVRGMIMMWSGQDNQIPNGWALCDGQNGTPDLTDKFIVGAGNKYTVNATGGEEFHQLTIDEMPSHDHSNESFGNFLQVTGQKTYHGSSDSSPHEPDLFTVGWNKTVGGSQAHENRPPFYALAFIMKL